VIGAPNPSPILGEGGTRREAVGGRGRALGRAREMRKHPTDAERRLWTLLRNHHLAGSKWKRQQTIGRYIVDFVCFEARLIVEADGAQHIDSGYDAARDTSLRTQGFRLLRFYNNDILAETQSVAAAILAALAAPAGASSPDERFPSPPPSPARGEGVHDGNTHA
jgi:very-short-patch-repair endonuclease